jgi:hypothetical protein
VLIAGRKFLHVPLSKKCKAVEKSTWIASFRSSLFESPPLLYALEFSDGYQIKCAYGGKVALKTAGPKF